MATAPRGFRLALARLALSFLGLLTAALLAEAGLRLFSSDPLTQLGQLQGMYASDGAGGVRTVPGFRTRQTVEGRTLSIELNSLGMRSPEPGARVAGEPRVLVLGDSNTFGWGVEQRESFPFQLGELLSARRPPRVVVGNAGIAGNSTIDELRNVRRLKAPFDPDLVIVAVYTGNDFEENFFGEKSVIDGYWFGEGASNLIRHQWRARFALHSRFAALIERLLTDHVPFLAMDRSADRPTEEEVTRAEGFPRNRLHALYMDAKEETPATSRILGRMTELLARISDEAKPARTLVAVIPSIAQVFPGIYESVLRERCGLDPAAHERGRACALVAERCARLGVPCVNLQPALAARADAASLYLLADQHLSPAGCRAVAELLVEPALAALAP